MRNKLCQVDFITFWDDGVISVDDGVGYTGEICTMETMELYQALRKFFDVEKVSSTNSAMADIARAFDDGFTAGGMGVVPKDIAWREWQRRQ